MWSSSESSVTSLTRSDEARREVPSVAEDVVERRELGNELDEER
jgi:hypothetical protein